MITKYNDLIGIYKITCKINGKIYIGCSKNIANRWTQHILLLNQGKHHNKDLQRDFNKYSIINFTFEIIEILNNIDQLFFKESFYILKYNSIDTNIGYNKNIGKIDNNTVLDNDIDLNKYLNTIDKETIELIKANIVVEDADTYHKLKDIKNIDNALSENWFAKNKNSYKLIKNSLNNYFKNRGSKTDIKIWTTFEGCRTFLEGKGYIKNYINIDETSTIKANRIAIACNIYPNSFNCNVKKSKADEYALIKIINFIVNNADINNSFNIFLPSLRMRALLLRWLDNNIA